MVELGSIVTTLTSTGAGAGADGALLPQAVRAIAAIAARPFSAAARGVNRVCAGFTGEASVGRSCQRATAQFTRATSALSVAVTIGSS